MPVTNLGVQDFTTTGDCRRLANLFQTIPAAQTTLPQSTISGGHVERNNQVNIRGLDTNGPRSLLMIDGVRFPGQDDGICLIDPSIIPELALDRVDILADGASATYGSDAIAGVVNVILKRRFRWRHNAAPFSDADRWWRIRGSGIAVVGPDLGRR